MEQAYAADDFEFVYRHVISIPHLFLKRAHACFDKLRATRRRIISGQAFAAESRGATLFADTQSGKSSIIRIYIQQNVVDYCYEIGLFPRDTPRETVAILQRKVMYISVSGTSTLMSLLEDILRAYGDPYPERGKTLGNKKQRVLNYIREFETELLIFDEMNHLRIDAPNGNLRTEATRVHNTLKDLLISGCPVVFVGTKDAEKKVLSCKQISARCPNRLFIGQLNWKDPEHKKCFHDYCGLVGLELERYGFFPKRSNFIEKATLACLFLAAGGYLGHASNIIAIAVEFAREDGADCVTWEHLSAASEEYTMREKLATYNPFRAWKTKEAA
ncbi:AAA ATPase domain-containing protein [Rhizobium phaseoli]|uniref:TniB family NTP-binding protein n=1 Tax=Rhizobium phaseoli TaxID=396 RepID=UPI0007EA7901|nr:TniB family NTP-binding protein [Rhizobium phaseoli]ANM04623.1 AAA ATPase domain-containing protein [Rhizobium phaseoli]